MQIAAKRFMLKADWPDQVAPPGGGEARILKAKASIVTGILWFILSFVSY